MPRTVALTDENFESVMQSFVDFTGEEIRFTKSSKPGDVWIFCLRYSVGAACDD